jgi:uncharacterized protein (TIGR03118 family)
MVNRMNHRPLESHLHASAEIAAAIPHSPGALDMTSARAAGLAACTVLAILAVPAAADPVSVTNLVTDDPTANAAQITDPGLVNAWGLSYSPTSPMWVSANGSGTADLYSINPASQATAKVGLTVNIPGDGTPTGQAFNGNTSAFGGDAFLFVSEDGTIAGWRGALGSNAETLQTGSDANVYKGAALATIGTNSYLYAANFRNDSIDVLKGSPASPALTGAFLDPSLPAGYAPFNIQNLGGSLYVTYALQDSAKHDEQAGAGRGFVDRFDLQGNLLGRIASGGSLNAPWGLAIAPSSFGALAGALLVGNFGDGRINAFNAISNTFLGQLMGTDGLPLSIDGLWALAPGNGGSGGSTNLLYFTAGPDDESHGLLGVMGPVPEPATITLLLAGLVGLRTAARRQGAGRVLAL